MLLSLFEGFLFEDHNKILEILQFVLECYEFVDSFSTFKIGTAATHFENSVLVSTPNMKIPNRRL